jgi:TPR repeat protein
MHEHGLGMKEDFHLAKRFYDMAAESSVDARAPASLALLSLGIKFKLKYCSEYIEMIQTLGLDILLGEDWDLYVMAGLAGLLLLIIMIYGARQQQELERNQRRQQQELERQRLIQEQEQQNQDTTDQAEEEPSNQEPQAQNQDQ